VIHDGVDTERFQPQADTDAGGPPAAPGTLSVGVVGRLSPNKGQDVFLRAAREVARAESRARFLLAGEAFLPGDDLFELELRRLAGVPELEGRVHFLGFHPDVSFLLSRLDLLVAPSRRESLGISVLEAMSAGLAVVASDRGGLRETIQDGITGLLVPEEDPSALAQAIVSLLGDIGRRREMGRNGRRRVTEEFSHQAMTRRVEELYDELTTSGREAKSVGGES
jgi:glycosyltransferase involved in cell wall biosynthesis